MGLGNYYAPENKELFLRRRLELAKEQIKLFPFLNSVLNNFDYIPAESKISYPLVDLIAAAKEEGGIMRRLIVV